MTLPQEITSTLFYDRYRPLSAKTILDEINEIMAPSGLAFAETDPGANWDACFSDGDISVSLRFSAKPEPAANFQAAVDSPYAKINFDDWDGVVRRHRQAIVIQAASRRPVNRDVFELLLTLGQITVNHLIVHHAPLAVHWAQSDQFFDAETFLLMADVLFPLPIFLHPKPFSSGRVAEGTQAMGFHLEGAEDILGKHVIFAEAPARIHYLLERAFAFVDHCRENGMILGDGAAFGMMVGETILVTHQAPSPDCPRGAVVLTLRERDGVFQLQPEGAPPLRDRGQVVEANALGAAAMNTNPNQAPATVGAPRSTGNGIDDFLSTPDAALAQRNAVTGGPNLVPEDGAARLREASRERLMEEQLASNRRVSNMQMLGAMATGGPAAVRLTPEVAPYFVWVSLALTALIHLPAAVVLGLCQLIWKPPHYVMLSGVFLVFLGATISGADPTLGYIDILGVSAGFGHVGDGAGLIGSLYLQTTDF